MTKKVGPEKIKCFFSLTYKLKNSEVVMGRIVAIAGGDLESTKPINEYALELLVEALK